MDSKRRHSSLGNNRQGWRETSARERAGRATQQVTRGVYNNRAPSAEGGGFGRKGL